jgi:hypothetical protein
MADKSDPTKDPEFQKVIRHFVTTPPRHHESLADEHKQAEKAKANREKEKKNRRSKSRPAANPSGD